MDDLGVPLYLETSIYFSSIFLKNLLSQNSGKSHLLVVMTSFRFLGIHPRLFSYLGIMEDDTCLKGLLTIAYAYIYIMYINIYIYMVEFSYICF